MSLDFSMLLIHHKNMKENEIVIRNEEKILTFEEFEKIYDDNEKFIICWNNKVFKINY